MLFGGTPSGIRPTALNMNRLREVSGIGRFEVRSWFPSTGSG
jgi:hypothetical protein